TPIAAAVEDDDDSFYEPDAAETSLPAPMPIPDEGGSGSRHTFGALATITVTGIDHDVVLSGERIVVGRLAECDVHIQDANISRQHAAFVAEGAGWAIEDLGSTNGTYVNGERAGHLRLRDGDVVTIGVTELVFHEPRV
ncbi:MAG: FHA domain-containing protein, partial [Actinobacteria bacterium]